MLGVIADDEHHDYQQFVAVFSAKIPDGSPFLSVVIIVIPFENQCWNYEEERYLIVNMVRTYCLMSNVPRDTLETSYYTRSFRLSLCIR